MKSSLASILAYGLLLLSIAAAIWSTTPPKLAPNSPFDQEQATSDLQRIARKPHPVGSLAHAEAREYIVQELAAAGLEVELQPGHFAGSDLVNIVASLPGTDSTGRILLLAHYDTMPASPGAGDDTVGVIALLETARALQGDPQRNDITWLISDGEERGLQGARMFARDQSMAGEVDTVLNFEAIGNGGPAYMFETGPGSGDLVREWTQAVPHAVGNSLAAVVYGWMNNDTDLSVFRDRGVRGLNFAICGASGFYHQASDTPEAFSPASLAHMGDTAIRSTIHFANLDLRSLERNQLAFVAMGRAGSVTWQNRIHIWLATFALCAFAIRLAKSPSQSPITWLKSLGQVLIFALVAGATAAVLTAAILFAATAHLPLTYPTINALALAPPIATCAAALTFARLRFNPACFQSASLLLWSLAFAFLASKDFTAIGVSFPLAIGAIAIATASALALFTHAKPWQIALPLTPLAFAIGPILAQLMHLSSQAHYGPAIIAGALSTFGALALAPLIKPRQDRA